LAKTHLVYAILLILILTAWHISVYASTTFGRWRDVNPTDYSNDVAGTLRGIYIQRGGSGSIGAGNGWAVGGDFAGTPNAAGIIAQYDGFSWQLHPAPRPDSVYYSVSFCRPPGLVRIGPTCLATENGADGWMVGSSIIGPAATYWSGSALMEVINGLVTSGVSNLTSVFMVCHSPGFALGCSGAFAAGGLTYAVGQAITADGPHGVICDFHGTPRSGGGWTCPFISSGAGNTQYNGVSMFVETISGVSSLGGFAVGTNGWIAQLNAGGWTESQPAPGVTFRSVFVVQAEDDLEAWAVGDSFQGEAQIWHFCCGSAGTWQGPVSPGATDQNLESVFLVSPTEGWIVGTQGVILYSTTLGSANQWIALTRPLQTAAGNGVNLIGLFFTTKRNGWAVGSNGVILNTQNSGCDNVVLSPCWGGNTGISRSQNLTTVFEINQNDAWAGGAWDFSDNEPAMIHWDGLKWHLVQVLPPPQLGGQPFNITSISMIDSNDGWAVGVIAHPNPIEIPFTLHWDGNTWRGSTSSQPICKCSVASVFMIGSSEGWAVGDQGQFFHYTANLNQWELFSQATGNPKLNSVFINNNGANQLAGWAVGNNGTVYQLSISGTTATWTQIKISALEGTTPNLYGVFFVDSNHGWIVGGHGTILTTTDGGLFWSGSEEQVVGAPPTAVLRSVFIDKENTGPGNGDGWAVGGTNETGTANAIFAHWDGQAWTATTISPPLEQGLALNCVYGQPGNSQDGWAVGAGPIPISPPTPTPLAGVFHLDPPNPPTSNETSSANTETTPNLNLMALRLTKKSCLEIAYATYRRW